MLRGLARPSHSPVDPTDGLRSERGRAGFWLAVAIGLPVVVVYGYLLGSAIEATPARALEWVGSVGERFALSLVLCLAPLGALPLRTRTYALWGGGGLALLLAANLVHVVEYREMITLGAIDAVASTTPREAIEFARARPWVVGLSVLGAIATLRAVWRIARRVPADHRLGRASRVGLLVAGLLAVAYVGVRPLRLFPISVAKNVYDYVQYRERYEAARAARAEFAFAASPGVEWEQPPVVALVIGESQRRDRLQVYGYGRETTPSLAALDSLVVFRDAVSAAPSTQAAVKAMLTSANAATVVDHAERSVVGLAREIGFRTVWISNQDRTDDTEVAALAQDAEHVVFTSHSWSAGGQYDEDVLPEVGRYLANRAEPLFLVVHLVGSHDDYSLRYPEAFHRFGGGGGPLSMRSGLRPAERAVSDHYDNSVLYTDHVIGEVIRQIEQTGAPALVAYLSDHGENLYDTSDRLMGHGGPRTTRYEVEVPFLVWASPTFRRARPEVLAALARNQGQPVSTADLFYTMADVLGADWEGFDPRRSLARDDYRPAERLVLTPHGEVVRYEDLRSADFADERGS